MPITPEGKFKASMKRRWDKTYPKTNKTACWTNIPGVQGFPDVYISIPGCSGLIELKVHPNKLNKNQQVMIPALSYGSNVFVITQFKSTLGWQEDTIKVVYWQSGVPHILQADLRWEKISGPTFWQELLHGNI